MYILYLVLTHLFNPKNIYCCVWLLTAYWAICNISEPINGTELWKFLQAAVQLTVHMILTNLSVVTGFRLRLNLIGVKAALNVFEPQDPDKRIPAMGRVLNKVKCTHAKGFHLRLKVIKPQNSIKVKCARTTRFLMKKLTWAMGFPQRSIVLKQSTFQYTRGVREQRNKSKTNSWMRHNSMPIQLQQTFLLLKQQRGLLH